MDITKEALIDLGFKRYYSDKRWRIPIEAVNIGGVKMYLTIVDFGDSYTWYINSFEQFAGVESLARLKAILFAVGAIEEKQ